MKWLALSMLCLTQISFATTPIENARLASTATFYNENFQTVGALTAFITEKNKTSGDEFAAYLKFKKIDLNAKMPRLQLVNEHLEVEGYTGVPFFMVPHAQDGLKITYDNFTNNVNVSMTLTQIQKAFAQTEKSKKIRETMINIFFPVAEADDIAAASARLVGSFGVDLTTVAMGSAYASEEADFSIRKKVRNFLHGRTRDNAIEACDKIQGGKTVKNPEKIIASLETLKKEIECRQWGPETYTGSCAWYDIKIACLKENQSGDDSSRASKKPKTPTESINSPKTQSSSKVK